MQVMDVRRGATFKVVGDAKVPPAAPEANNDEVYKMGRLDGMYCYCFDSNGERCYFAAWTEVVEHGNV